MTSSQRLQRVRDYFGQWLQENLTEQDAETVPRETVFIRDGFYVGRRFQTGNVSAIWFAEEDELKIYASDGSVLTAIRQTEVDVRGAMETPTRRAA